MSRQHARVRLDGERFKVTDLGSQNGTWVDGQRVPSGETCEAQRVIRVGDSLFVPSLDVGALAQRGVKIEDGYVRGPAFQALLETVAQVARLGATLHIHGESGAGKERVARAFHEANAGGAGPFVAVNCSTIPEGVAERLLFGARRGSYSGADADTPGYFQAADGGTLFLDEVVDLDLQVQAKLLRVLETREVLQLGSTRAKKIDVRICSATNKSLRELASSGRLREDLYFRIGRPSVTLPPLRERPEEIPFLLHQEIKRLAPELRLHVSLVEACLLRVWPGNVRELLVETLAAVQAATMDGAKKVEARHLAPEAGASLEEKPEPEPKSSGTDHSAKPIPPELRARIEEALRDQEGNVAAAARALGMHRTHLRRLIERHDIRAASGPIRSSRSGDHE